MSAHVHIWNLVTHMDGCHWALTVAACACGATLRQEAERDLRDDPYAAVWMDEDGQPEGEPCDRCRALLDGAEPKLTTEVIPA
jgi:hypothetical protein